jgi:oligopeptide/dipeptide ABC transporter ATP-binding protein
MSTQERQSLAPGRRPPEPETLLQVDELTKIFHLHRGRRRRSPQALPALSGVSFDVQRGETFGLVGESGCGKSTAARCIVRLIEPSSGRVLFDDIDVLGLDREDMRKLRRRIQIVFQDPVSSLDPRFSVRQSLEEPLIIHGSGDRSERSKTVREALELVGVSERWADRKPHAFSGGQRQRVGVARALILRPELVILDEPVSALDVSIQAQILNLLRRLQDELQLTYVFIVHDLAIAEYFCDRLAVIYLGQVMELGKREDLFRSPLHPYTVALLSAAPVPEPGANQRASRIILRGEVTADGAHAGCPFEPRCPIGHGRSVCSLERPPLEQPEDDHWVACHFPGELTKLQRPVMGG